MVKTGKQSPFVLFFLLFLMFVVSTLLIFLGTQRELTKIGGIAKPQSAAASGISNISNSPTTPQVAAEAVSKSVQGLKGEVTRRMRVERGSDIIENVFFQGNQEIVRQTVAKDGKVTQSGRIPDGLVKFYDDFHNTYGEEHYRYNRKHGITKTFYYAGRLKSEERYSDGKLLHSKEYYNTGV